MSFRGGGWTFAVVRLVTGAARQQRHLADACLAAACKTMCRSGPKLDSPDIVRWPGYVVLLRPQAARARRPGQKGSASPDIWSLEMLVSRTVRTAARRVRSLVDLLAGQNGYKITDGFVHHVLPSMRNQCTVRPGNGSPGFRVFTQGWPGLAPQSPQRCARAAVSSVIAAPLSGASRTPRRVVLRRPGMVCQIWWACRNDVSCG
jgi:hypothetical protein